MLSMTTMKARQPKASAPAGDFTETGRKEAPVLRRS
jgi:hypothetical protein